MLKYRGQYRTTYEMNSKGKPCEFAIVPCTIKKGSNICRHNDNTLNVYIPSARIGKRLTHDYSNIFTMYQDCEGECTLLFSESLIKEAAKILKARIKGKNVSPRAKRNATLI